MIFDGARDHDAPLREPPRIVLVAGALSASALVLWLGGFVLRPLVPTCGRMGVVPDVVCLPGVTAYMEPKA